VKDGYEKKFNELQKSLIKIETEQDDDDEEDCPEDLKDIDPDVKMRKILLRSFTMMLTGTIVVLVFSDPMVDVLNMFGTITTIPPF